MSTKTTIRLGKIDWEYDPSQWEHRLVRWRATERGELVRLRYRAVIYRIAKPPDDSRPSGDLHVFRALANGTYEELLRASLEILRDLHHRPPRDAELDVPIFVDQEQDLRLHTSKNEGVGIDVALFIRRD